MEFAIGFAFGIAGGVAMSFVTCYVGLKNEWTHRKDIERDVKKLMRAFACGQGFVGCTGGPRCSSDHK